MALKFADVSCIWYMLISCFSLLVHVPYLRYQCKVPTGTLTIYENNDLKYASVRMNRNKELVWRNTFYDTLPRSVQMRACHWKSLLNNLNSIYDILIKIHEGTSLFTSNHSELISSYFRKDGIRSRIEERETRQRRGENTPHRFRRIRIVWAIFS